MAAKLGKIIKGSRVTDCFSNSMDELCLDFEKLTVRCIFHEGTVFFYFNDAAPGKNRLFKPQFPDIKDTIVTDVVIHPFERSFHLEFENNRRLVFKCHGRKSNILLFENGQNTDQFRKQLEKDAELTMEDIRRPVSPVYDAKHFKDPETFLSAYPYLPREFYAYVQPPSEEKFVQAIHTLRQIKGFSIADALDLSPLFEGDTILEDINRFTGKWLKEKGFAVQKEKLRLKYEKLIRDTRIFIEQNQQALKNILEGRSEEEIGNIILSNLHLIPEGSKKVTLNDIYANRPVEIKLDEKLSAVENAEKYFRKEKNKPLLIRQLKEKIARSETILREREQKLEEIMHAGESKSLRHLVSEEEKTKAETDLPFRKFSFGNYDILVGKHAESNEKILNYYSDKNDTWLHAKDVAGSHVLVKARHNETIPQDVLEKAASLAAYYSKNRNQALVTVAYTLRKYVRKIKGAEKGKVTVSNEKTLLVKPGK
mgnify:CR=1 FL=1